MVPIQLAISLPTQSEM